MSFPPDPTGARSAAALAIARAPEDRIRCQRLRKAGVPAARPRNDVIVVEWGAKLEGSSDHEREARHLCSIVQRVDEQPGALMLRVMEAMAKLEREARPVAFAIVACNDRLDDQATTSRRLVVQTMFTALARGRGQLILTGGERAAVREGLFALADALLREHVGAGVTVTLRFDRSAGQRTEDAPLSAKRGARVSRNTARDSVRR